MTEIFICRKCQTRHPTEDEMLDCCHYKKLVPMSRAERDEAKMILREEEGKRKPDMALITCLKMMMKVVEIEDAVIEMQKEVFKNE